MGIKERVERTLLTRGADAVYPALSLGSGWAVEEADDGTAIVRWHWDSARTRITEYKQRILEEIAAILRASGYRVSSAVWRSPGPQGDEPYLKVR